MGERSSTTATHGPNTDSDSITALDYIKSQLQLEEDARESLPYSFDHCTRPLGRLRQPIYSCLTCTSKTAPPRFSETLPTGSAALCYSCQISCHGDHEIVEIFEKRDVVCECGTEKFNGAEQERCELRKCQNEPVKEGEGMTKYGQNFWGRFCECEVVYKADEESGTMFQCFLGDVCGEDWFHDTCIVGKGPPVYGKGKTVEKAKTDEKKEEETELKEGEQAVKPEEATAMESDGPKPGDVEKGSGEGALPGQGERTASAVDVETPGGSSTAKAQNADDDDDEEEPCEGFPKEDFEHFICYRCVEANSWLKNYAGKPGFLQGVPRAPPLVQALERLDGVEHGAPAPSTSEVAVASVKETPLSPSAAGKRKAEDLLTPPDAKRTKTPDPTSIIDAARDATNDSPSKCNLPPPPESSTPISLFLKADFREHICRCPSCFPLLSRHRCLLEEEESYSPPEDKETASESGSLFDRGEKALGNIDRVRAIQGVTAFNALRDNLKGFLKGFAESGKPVGAEDIRAHFAALRGDVVAAKKEGTEDNGEGIKGGDSRKEGEGY